MQPTFYGWPTGENISKVNACILPSIKLPFLPKFTVGIGQQYLLHIFYV
jgi:hypothetical protein